MDALSRLREACAQVAGAALHVQIERDAIPGYAAGLPLDEPTGAPDPAAHLTEGPREGLAAFWLTLDAINFGSGWFPTLTKRPGRSGYFTVASGVRERFEAHGPWSAAELSAITPDEMAGSLSQDPSHELMGLYAASLNDLGRHITDEFGGKFSGPVDAAAGSVMALVERLAAWRCFADSSSYEGIEVRFLKRAQITAADLAEVRLAEFRDLERLTMFADNLVPHVLRLDGILRFDSRLVDRIEQGELIEYGSPEEVEIRACALHAVELIVAKRSDSRACDVDRLLWHRGQQARYKASPRHRCRCTAY
jgi:Potential Queuosine, Q, salvage protein family